MALIPEEENTEEIDIEEIQKEKKKQDFIQESKKFIVQLIIWLTAMLLFIEFLFRPVRVSGSSMYPTLVNNEFGFVNVIDRKIHGLKRFDIVIIHLENKYIIKRVIGLPGETVAYLDGQLYINEEPVDEPFLNTDYAKNYEGTFMENVQPITLGEDEYYCLGDNRPNSADSRVYGPFKASQISAKNLFVLFK